MASIVHSGANLEKALASSDDISRLMILDRRAATYTRMNKLDLALHDGKHMIKLDKSNPIVRQNHRSHGIQRLTFPGLFSSWQDTAEDAETRQGIGYLSIRSSQRGEQK